MDLTGGDECDDVKLGAAPVSPVTKSKPIADKAYFYPCPTGAFRLVDRKVEVAAAHD